MPSNARTTRLVIVESPSKAKTIAGYLGPDYFVEASFGHVRDLPKNADEVPEKYKGGSASTSTTASTRSTWSPPTASSRSRS